MTAYRYRVAGSLTQRERLDHRILFGMSDADDVLFEQTHRSRLASKPKAGL